MKPLPATLGLLKSRMLAAILILSLATACVIGAVVPQRGTEAHDDWAANSPRLASVADALGLDEVFRSVPVAAVVALLGLSIVVCTASRLGGLLKRGGKPLLATVLARRRLLGSVAFHAGVFMALAGAAASATMRREGRTNIIEGQAAPIRIPRAGDDVSGQVLLFMLRLDKFNPVHKAPWGHPDYSSDVTVIDAGCEAASGNIRVNAPLSYGGIELHQSTHGFAPRFTLTTADGRALLRHFVSLSTHLESTPVRYRDRFGVPGTGIEIDAEFFPDAEVVDGGLRSASPDPKRPAAVIAVSKRGREVFRGTVTRESPATLPEGLTFGFDEVRYWSALDIVYDPGVIWIFVGSWIAIAGLSVRFSAAACRRRENGSGEAPAGDEGKS